MRRILQFWNELNEDCQCYFDDADSCMVRVNKDSQHAIFFTTKQIDLTPKLDIITNLIKQYYCLSSYNPTALQIPLDQVVNRIYDNYKSRYDNYNRKVHINEQFFEIEHSFLFNESRFILKTQLHNRSLRRSDDYKLYLRKWLNDDYKIMTFLQKDGLNAYSEAQKLIPGCFPFWLKRSQYNAFQSIVSMLNVKSLEDILAKYQNMDQSKIEDRWKTFIELETDETFHWGYISLHRPMSKKYKPKVYLANHKLPLNGRYYILEALLDLMGVYDKYMCSIEKIKLTGAK